MDKMIEIEMSLDADMLQWFQDSFDNWQAAMNAVLVLHCEQQKKK